MNEAPTDESLKRIQCPIDVESLDKTILRLRNRALLLRLQAYLGIITIAILAITLIMIFSNHKPATSGSDSNLTTEKAREPYDYRLMEQKHGALSEKLSELIDAVEATKQDLIYNKYAIHNRQEKAVAESMENRLNDLRKIKVSLDDRLSKDRQNMTLEISKIREERDYALREGAERRLLLILVGDVAFRVGALVLALYLTSVIFNLCKYLLRVADHLNSTADSIDLLRHTGLGVERGISALTPHPIDFHIDDVLTIKSAKDLFRIFRDTHDGIKDKGK